MDNNNIIIQIIYYAGIASCAAQGAEKGKYKNSFPVLHYIANAFGGGFMRDVLFLRVHPWLFTLSALPDLAIVVIIGFLYTYYFFINKANEKQYDIVMWLVTITDAFGLSSFICIGMDRALRYSSNIFTIVACGYVTAIGGGILASGKQFTKIFKSKEAIRYHLVTLLGCCYYCIFKHSLFLVYFITAGLFLASIDYGILYRFYFYNTITPCHEVFLLYPVIYNRNHNFQRWKIAKTAKEPRIHSERSKIYLIQHRIRQC
ncbi:MAG: hypothetical protein HDQ99_10655 [Lachnospiraceae bacterium]|nr:hypothetical protein [Lachnospiraceae bacterium]